MSSITSANLADAIPKLVSAEALEALIGELVMGNLVNRDYEPMLANYGDTVNVAIPPILTANNIIESGSVVPQNPSPGNAQIVLDTHAEATFVIPDVTKAITAPDIRALYMQPAINALAEKIEGDLLNQYALFTFNTAVGGVSAMDEARIDLAETELFAAKVPKSQRRNLIVSATAFGQMRQIPRFTEYQTGVNRNQDSPIQTGQLAGDGNIKGFEVFRSQYVPKVSTTTFNMAFARDALSLVIRRLPQPLPGTGVAVEYAEIGNFGLRVVMSYQPNTLSQQFTVDVFYGVGVLRQSFGVQVQSN